MVKFLNEKDSEELSLMCSMAWTPTCASSEASGSSEARSAGASSDTCRAQTGFLRSKCLYLAETMKAKTTEISLLLAGSEGMLCFKGRCEKRVCISTCEAGCSSESRCARATSAASEPCMSKMHAVNFCTWCSLTHIWAPHELPKIAS